MELPGECIDMIYAALSHYVCRKRFRRAFHGKRTFEKTAFDVAHENLELTLRNNIVPVSPRRLFHIKDDAVLLLRVHDRKQIQITRYVDELFGYSYEIETFVYIDTDCPLSRLYLASIPENAMDTSHHLGTFNAKLTLMKCNDKVPKQILRV
jgi:hypothetical protein